MRESLFLFDETPARERGPRVEKPAKTARDRHLEAARRLSRRIGRLPDHSDQQVEAGQSICRHLLAMLRESLAPGGAGRPPETPPH